MESALRDGAGQPGLTLIETLGWDGAAFPRLSLHMARLTRSAARLGWPCAGAEAALRAAAPAGPARMRLTLDRDGRIEVQVGPMPAGPSFASLRLPPSPSLPTGGEGAEKRFAAGELPADQGAPLPPVGRDGEGGVSQAWRLGLADTRLQSDDPWLTLKTTRRPAYDAARAALPPGLDEVIFLNERGEVCDGTITTLFFDRGQGLRTPPLTCGLLPGVLRADLALPEEVLLASDLPRVHLWVGNSLRGLIPAVWAG